MLALFVAGWTLMTVAMMLGMCILGMTFRQLHLAVFGTGFDEAWHEHTELAVFANNPWKED